VRQLGPQRAGQVVPDVADRHPPRIQRYDHVGEAAGASFPLGDQPGFEAAGPVPRHLQRDLPDLRLDRLGGGPVAGVPAAPPGHIALDVAQVPGQLRGQPPLQDRLDHLGQEPALPGQLHTPGVDLREQVVEQAGLGHRPHRRPHRRLAGSGDLGDAERLTPDLKISVVLKIGSARMIHSPLVVVHSHGHLRVLRSAPEPYLHRTSDTPRW